ncbi:MAG: hypothetical protein L6253_05980, partial [Candidatus Atribacteria bacterium]|nr:hypothetical protein [Candidatus Atribacteria bacterium]
MIVMEGFLETVIHQTADICHTFGGNKIENFTTGHFLGFYPTPMNQVLQDRVSQAQGDVETVR